MIEKYISADGTTVSHCDSLDFRRDHDYFGISGDNCDKLVSGMHILFHARFNWHLNDENLSSRSRLVVLRADFAEEFSVHHTPKNKFNPHIGAVAELPVFKMALLDFRGTIALGEAAIAYLREGDGPCFYSEDLTQNLCGELRTQEISKHLKPSFRVVADNSLHLITPAT